MGVFTGKAADFNAKWRIHEQIESARSSKIDDSELNGASASKETVKSSKKISPTYHRRKTRVYFPYDCSTLRYGNEAKPNDEQATRVAYFKSEMFALWPPKLPGLSRGVVFYFGML